MNWAEVMKERADLASRDLVAMGASVMHERASAAWEPHEVWITRVKRPRDLAAFRLRDNDVNPAELSPG